MAVMRRPEGEVVNRFRLRVGLEKNYAQYVNIDCLVEQFSFSTVFSYNNLV